MYDYCTGTYFLKEKMMTYSVAVLVTAFICFVDCCRYLKKYYYYFERLRETSGAGYIRREGIWIDQGAFGDCYIMYLHHIVLD